MAIGQGDVCWAQLPPPTGSGPGFRRPVVVIQGNALNRSRIATAVCIPLTTNLRLANAPGNVLLKAQTTGLKRDSVANVSQIVTLDRQLLEDATEATLDRNDRSSVQGARYRYRSVGGVVRRVRLARPVTRLDNSAIQGAGDLPQLPCETSPAALLRCGSALQPPGEDQRDLRPVAGSALDRPRFSCRRRHALQAPVPGRRAGAMPGRPPTDCACPRMRLRCRRGGTARPLPRDRGRTGGRRCFPVPRRRSSRPGSNRHRR